MSKEINIYLMPVEVYSNNSEYTTQNRAEAEWEGATIGAEGWGDPHKEVLKTIWASLGGTCPDLWSVSSKDAPVIRKSAKGTYPVKVWRGGTIVFTSQCIKDYLFPLKLGSLNSKKET